MSVLVTGGTGFVGRAVCQRLLDRGSRVLVLTRERRRATAHFGEAVTALESLNEIADAATPEAIVNLAGRSLGSARWTKATKDDFVGSRVRTTRALLEYIGRTRNKPRVLVSGSAVGYYGARGDEELDERSNAGDEYQSDLCKAWETEAGKARAFGVRVCLLRMGVVLGPGGGALSSLLPTFRLGLGGHLGHGDQWMSWIHLDDLTSIIERLLTDDALDGAFNCTAPYPVTNRLFAHELARSLGRPALLRVPGWAVRLKVGAMAHLFLTGQRVLPRRISEAGYRFAYPDLHAALTNILHS